MLYGADDVRLASETVGGSPAIAIGPSSSASRVSPLPQKGIRPGYPLEEDRDYDRLRCLTLLHKPPALK